MNSGTLKKRTSTTRTDRNSGWMPKQGQTIASKEDDVYNSNSDDDTNNSECYDLESNQLKQVNYEDEFRDVDLEELVNSEGPQEMLLLMLQEQSDEFMTEEVTDSDDYADWIKWVSDAEQSRQVVYESTQDTPVPLLLQQPIPTHNSLIPVLLQTVQVKDGDFDSIPAKNLASSNHPEADIRWKEIY